MRYLKLFKESVQDTKEEIEEIVSTCKDILLEAQHTFGNSDVEKSYKDDKVIINCFYKMPFDMKGKLEEYKSAMDDIHSRLIEYMTSQGFTYNNRGDRYTAYFDMRLNNITYNISFSKELDREFIGHLRYLKKYNINESNSSEEFVSKDIKEICYDLTDYNRFSVDIRYNTSYSSRTGKDEWRWVIFISLKNHLDYDGFLLSEVEDVLMRIKSYLGERRYLGCEVLKVGEPHRSAMRYVTNEDRLSSIFIYYTL